MLLLFISEEDCEGFSKKWNECVDEIKKDEVKEDRFNNAMSAMVKEFHDFLAGFAVYGWRAPLPLMEDNVEISHFEPFE